MGNPQKDVISQQRTLAHGSRYLNIEKITVWLIITNAKTEYLHSRIQRVYKYFEHNKFSGSVKVLRICRLLFIVFRKLLLRYNESTRSKKYLQITKKPNFNNMHSTLCHRLLIFFRFICSIEEQYTFCNLVYNLCDGL